MFEIFLVMSSICIEDFNPAFHCHNFLSGLAFAEGLEKMILLSGP